MASLASVTPMLWSVASSERVFISSQSGTQDTAYTDLNSVCYNLAHGAWTDALGRRVEQQDLGVGFLSISCPLTPGIRLYGVEVVETGDFVDSKKRQENQGFTANPVKTKWGRSSVG
jgi:hypothetical protein